jgi:hypothetical protein
MHGKGSTLRTLWKGHSYRTHDFANLAKRIRPLFTQSTAVIVENSDLLSRLPILPASTRARASVFAFSNWDYFPVSEHIPVGTFDCANNDAIAQMISLLLRPPNLSNLPIIESPPVVDHSESYAMTAGGRLSVACQEVQSIFIVFFGRLKYFVIGVGGMLIHRESLTQSRVRHT